MAKHFLNRGFRSGRGLVPGLVLTVLGVAAFTAWSPGGLAEPVDRPFAVSVTTEDTAERLRGRVTAVDEAGVTLTTADGPRALRWEQLDDAALLQVRGRTLDRADGRGWLDTAWTLARRDASAVTIEGALARGLRAEPTLADDAAAIRRGEAPSWWEEPTPAETPDSSAIESPLEGHGAAGGVSGGVPETIGDIQAERWGQIDPALMQVGLAEQEAWLAEGMRVTGLELDVYRDASRHFLLATDLRESEASRWARELDRMYAVMCRMFELPPEDTLFLGKAVIVILREAEDYHRWNAGTLGNPVLGTLGVCVGYGDGHVRISFFRQPQTEAFASLLVHETTHGFLHRYRSPGRIPSWLNEGLAEVIAHRLFPGAEDVQLNRRIAQRFAWQAARQPGSFFEAPNIPGEYYPVAYYFAEYLLAQDGERFRALINAIKDGKTAEAALAEDYGVPGETLLQLFANEMTR